MKKMNFVNTLCLSLVMTFTGVSAFSQASPPATATGAVNGANITVKYCSPSVKGRVIWGGLVPFDKVWRAGANAATTLETDKDIKVEGKKLPAGKYSLYLVPGEKECTIIINSQTGQWGINRDGSTTEDPAKDVIRVTVKQHKSAAMNERLAYTISNKGLVLSWENWDIPVSIK